MLRVGAALYARTFYCYRMNKVTGYLNDLSVSSATKIGSGERLDDSVFGGRVDASVFDDRVDDASIFGVVCGVDRSFEGCRRLEGTLKKSLCLA